MLVLSRKKNQTIRVDGPCVITLCELRGEKARIGITAERNIPVVRGELVPDAPASITPSPVPTEELLPCPT